MLTIVLPMEVEISVENVEISVENVEISVENEVEEGSAETT